MRRLFGLALLLLVAVVGDARRRSAPAAERRVGALCRHRRHRDGRQPSARRRQPGSPSWRAKFPFAFVVMMGDNLYGGDRPRDYQNEFEIPYKTLLDAGVKFYASLGNHDNPNERLYKPFNMNGERYYSFKPERASVRFFALDSNYIDDKQLDWLDKQLADSGSDWKICFFHHPPYSSGETHGSAVLQREKLEPMFVKHGVNVVLSGHEHFYERIKPQKGIQYFILGNSAKVRRGDSAEDRPDRERVRSGLHVHDRGNRRRRPDVPDDFRQGDDDRRGNDSPRGQDRTDAGRSAQPVQPGPAPKAPAEALTSIERSCR